MPYFVVFQNFKTNFCLILLNNMHQQLNMRVHELMRLRAFEVSFGKTSKIIFIPFSITFSTCVFWSQHDSPQLLSPFNRWLKHTERQICLSISQIKCNNEKIPPFFLGGSFSTGLYLGDLMLWSSSLFLSTLLSYNNCRNTCQTCLPIFPPQICPALCMWSLEHRRATAETQRQEYYCCLSRKKAD